MTKAKNQPIAALSKEKLDDLVSEYQARIATALAPYDLESVALPWLDTLRAIEEVINLTMIEWDDEVFEHQLFGFPVFHFEEHIGEIQSIRRRLMARFSENFANRFYNLLLQGAAIAKAFAANGAVEVARKFQTLESMIDYLQSRRRHFVALLHLMPSACRGSRRVDRLDTLNICIPIVEFSALPMMGAQYGLMVKLAQERLGMADDEGSELAMLDRLYLEPERAPIVEMPISDEGRQMLKFMESVLPDRLFSAAELRNDILLIEAAYVEFDLRGTDFTTAASLVRQLSNDYIDRDFWIRISTEELTSIMKTAGASSALRSALICHDDSYMKCLSSYAPMVLINGRYLSTVTLLSRFIYSWRARILERKKRFQIRAGFIFEDRVQLSLEEQGFIVQDIVRINRQEFDVVTIRDGVIWNVQCKNNFIDLASVDSDATSFARYNLMLVRSYERALDKERNREHLLKQKLSIDAIQHMVVSRFPLVTDNPRIIVFSRIADFARRADELLT